MFKCKYFKATDPKENDINRIGFFNVEPCALIRNIAMSVGVSYASY